MFVWQVEAIVMSFVQALFDVGCQRQFEKNWSEGGRKKVIRRFDGRLMYRSHERLSKWHFFRGRTPSRHNLLLQKLLASYSTALLLHPTS